MSKDNPTYLDFLSKIDILVDGRYKFRERNLSLLFRGSSNQRLIDVPKTLESGEIVLLDEDAYLEKNSFKRKKMYV